MGYQKASKRVMVYLLWKRREKSFTYYLRETGLGSFGRGGIDLGIMGLAGSEWELRWKN